MKLSDFVVEYLIGLGIKDIFELVGGTAGQLVDSLGKYQDMGKVRYIAVRHEQAGAMAVEGYSRITGFGAMIATSGPGATNLMTGILGAYDDSIPCLFITGQVPTMHARPEYSSHDIRQIGVQEAPIVPLMRPITKYSAYVKEPWLIRYYLDKAVYIANSGRPGPVHLDIPKDVQGAEVDPESLPSFNPVADKIDFSSKPQNFQDLRNLMSEIEQRRSEEANEKELHYKITILKTLIEQSERPVVLLGGGIKISNTVLEAKEFVEKLGAPVVVSWGGFDSISHFNPFFIGPIGDYSGRAGNFTVQNCDLVISLGSRLDSRQTGTRVKDFARAARLVMVDISWGEILKPQGKKPDLSMCCDLRDFFKKARELDVPSGQLDFSDWLKKAKVYKLKYPTVKPEYYDQETEVNPYVFIRELSRCLTADIPAITDCGGNLIWTMNSFEVKEGQRMFSSYGCSSMGYSMAAAIGASLALGKKPVACIIGDGGMQMNIQELETIKHYEIPLKIFVINSDSYAIILQTQDASYGGRYTGSVPECGYSAPDFNKIADAYGIKNLIISSHADIPLKIIEAIEYPGPIVCNVKINRHHPLIPRVQYDDPLEDGWPYLSEEEFRENMIIEPLPRKTTPSSITAV